MTTCDLILDLSKPQGAVQRLFSRTGDDGSLTIRAHVRDGGHLVQASGKTARFKALRPDRSLVVADAEVTNDDGDMCVTYALSASDVSVPGVMGLCYFAIRDEDGTVASTETFAVLVDLGAEDQTLTDMRPYVNVIDELMDGIEASAERADGAAVDATEAAAAARSAAANTATANADVAELARSTAEQSRVTAEGARASAEDARATAEQSRVTAESGRVSAENLREARFAEMELRSKGWLRHYCAEGEYDVVTGKPTVDDPDDATIYFVPDSSPDATNGFVEWIVDTSGDEPGWERMGTTTISVDCVTVDEIEAISDDEALTGGSVLNLTGLTALWARIKAKFAPKSHTHNASDITAGQLAEALIANGTITADMLAASAVTTAKIADGAVTDAKLSQPLRDSISRGTIETANGEKISIWSDSSGYISIMATRPDGSWRRANIMNNGTIIWTESD